MARRYGGRRTGVLAGAAVAALLAVPGVASAAVTSSVAGGTLTVTSDAADAIAITCVANQVKINGADPGTGVANCDAITSIVVNGGPGANNINLAGVTTADPAVDTDFPAVTSVTIDGGGDDDAINGSQYPDTIRGGNGHDRIIGDNNAGGTRDNAQGENGNDTLVWNPGDGDDINEGGDGTDTIEVNGGGGGEQFEVKPSATPGRVQFDRTGPTPPGPFNLDIGTAERLDMNANGGDDTFTAQNGLNALGFALDVDGGADNDILDGGDGPDLLTGGDGNDRIVGDDNPLGTRDNAQGGAGDDTMVWNPGDGDDLNEGGDGNDTVEVNGGGVGEQFQVKPSATPGRVQFDRTGPTPPGPFSIDIGTSEHLVLNAGDGNDKITGKKGLNGLIQSTFNGDGGNDTITGTDAADLVSGGTGLDVINTRDKAADQVECDGGFDFAFVDRRDTVRGCEVVLGGTLRVKHSGKVLRVTGNVATAKLTCVATQRCTGTARLLRGGKSLGSKTFSMKRNKSKTVRIKLGPRGRGLLAKASAKGLAVQLRIDARDSRGNGWRTTSSVRLR